MVQATILITEDDPFTRNLLARCFENEGYRVEQAANGREMLDKLARRMPDLVLLDKALPDEDGFVLLRQLRTHSTIPVVILSAHAGDADRIADLEIGADDYVSKFWKSQELIARVSSVLRRCRAEAGRKAAEDGRLLNFAGFTLDTEGHTLLDESGRSIGLTTAEFRLLCALARAKGRTLSRDKLLDALGHGAEAPQDRTGRADQPPARKTRRRRPQGGAKRRRRARDNPNGAQRRLPTGGAVGSADRKEGSSWMRSICH